MLCYWFPEDALFVQLELEPLVNSVLSLRPQKFDPVSLSITDIPERRD